MQLKYRNIVEEMIVFYSFHFGSIQQQSLSVLKNALQ